MGDDLYGGTNRYFNKVAAKHGIDFKMVDVREPKNVEAALTPKTKARIRIVISFLANF